MSLADLLDAHDLGDKFEIVQEDSHDIRCRDCGKDLKTYTADLHVRHCPEERT